MGTLHVLTYSVGTPCFEILCGTLHVWGIPGILSAVSILLCYFCVTTAFGGTYFCCYFVLFCDSLSYFTVVGMPSLTLLQDRVALKSTSTFLCFP